MVTRRKKLPPIDLTAVRVKAGAICFDSLGHILIDPKVQAEAGSFQLPGWVGGTETTGTVVACPDTACGNAACEPESVCADVNCEPEGACADVLCEPESACADVMCEPESVCADAACGNIMCEPESVCADANCEPESKCTDIFCREKNKGCDFNTGCTSGPDEPAEVEPL